MKSKNSEAFIEQALVKSYSRGGRTVRLDEKDLNVNYTALRNWMKRKAVCKLNVSATKEKRLQDWGTEEKLVALHEPHGLSGDTLHAWYRGRGLFAREHRN